jgi:DNA-binding transcriptional ArsR family regulator
MNASDVVQALGALAQESRLEVYRQLVQAGPAGLAAGAIRDRVGIPAPTLSFHLAQLGHAGLITSRKAGRSVIYAADYQAMRELLGFLTENCCRGSECAPEPARVEPRRKKR